MAGNFSIRRDLALQIGGFDEQFVRVAYNFEAEFAYRWRNAGHRIYFEPTAVSIICGSRRRYADVRRTLAQFPTQSCRWRLLLLPTDLVGEEKYGAIYGSPVACYLDTSSPPAAVVDSGNSDRGVFGYGLGAGTGGPRSALHRI